MKNELFVISPRTFAAASTEAVRDTKLALLELGLFKLPFKEVDIMIKVEPATSFNLRAGSPMDLVDDILNGKARALQWAHTEESCMTLTFQGVSLDKVDGERHEIGCDDVIMETTPPKYKFDRWSVGTQAQMDIKSAIQSIVTYLIVMLATKNTLKKVVEHKLAKLGIGKHRTGLKSYPRVTTIDVPEDRPDHPDHATEGKPKAAHLRRGHIRNQKYGPALTFVKRVWIEPIFVNADEDYVSTRERYNVLI